MQNNAFLAYLHKYSFVLVKLPEGLNNTPIYLQSWVISSTNYMYLKLSFLMTLPDLLNSITLDLSILTDKFHISQ